MAEKKEGKYLCADLLAVFGVMMLLGLEYLKSVGFMEMPVTYDSAVPIAVRWFCLSGAMLLSACTGYVLSTKRLSWRSVRPLFRLLYIYVVSSLAALLMQRIIFEDYLTKDDVFAILRDFTATETARFAGMYMMLILFAPFLSAAFHGLKTYNARLAFLAVTAGVSTLQPMLVVSGYYVLPVWLKMLAPFAGFIGGAFVRRYAKNTKRIVYFLLLLVVCGLQTAAVVYICADRGILCYPQFDSMASLPSLIIALLTLSLFHSSKKGDTALHRFFSNASGGAIVALIIGDTVIDFVLPSLSEYFPQQESLLLTGLAAVPVIFILCCTVGIFAQIPVFIIRTLFGEDEYEEDDDEDEEPEKKPVSKKNKAKPIRRLEPVPEFRPEPKPEPVPEFRPEPKPEPVPEFRPEPKPEPIPEFHPEPKPEPVPEFHPEPKPTPVHVHQKPATLGEILEEQGIPAQRDSVDELIAKITNEEKK